MRTIDYMEYMGKIEQYVRDAKNKSKTPVGFSIQKEDDWSIKDSRNVVVRGRNVKLSSILGDKNITTDMLQSKTEEILSILEAGGYLGNGRSASDVSKVYVDRGVIQLFFEGEDPDNFRAGKLFTIRDLYPILSLNKELASRESRFKGFNTTDYSSYSKVNAELVANGFKRVLSKELSHFKEFDKKDISEVFEIWTHKAGVFVSLSYIRERVQGATDFTVSGSVFVFGKSKSMVLRWALPNWDGDGTSMRKNLYPGFTNDLKKAYTVSDVEWLTVFTRESDFNNFIIHSGSKELSYLGGKIRQSIGGENAYTMLGDVYSSYELGMLCSVYEFIAMNNMIAYDDKFVNQKMIDSVATKYKYAFLKKYPNRGTLVDKCTQYINNAYYSVR